MSVLIVLLFIAALVFFAVEAFQSRSKIAAGLACAMLAFILSNSAVVQRVLS